MLPTFSGERLVPGRNASSQVGNPLFHLVAGNVFDHHWLSERILMVSPDADGPGVCLIRLLGPPVQEDNADDTLRRSDRLGSDDVCFPTVPCRRRELSSVEGHVPMMADLPIDEVKPRLVASSSELCPAACGSYRRDSVPLMG